MIKIDKISIVVPVLNEGKNLIKLTTEIKKVKNKNKIKNFEIIFFDDNSSDNSLEIFKSLKKKDKNIKFFIRKNIKKDLSQSCILGFKKAIYKNILVMDGDLQHPPRFIESLSKTYFKENADIVIGSRNLFNKKDPGLSLLRYISSIIIIHFINLFLNKKTSDPLSGFFIFKKEIYTKNKLNLYARGYKILADLIYSSKNELKIIDRNIFFDTRRSGKSKMNIFVLIKLLIFILKVFFSKLSNFSKKS